MKDSYTFDRDDEGLQAGYEKHIGAYERIFDRAGLRWYRVESDVGMMGGTRAHEYMAPCPAGEDDVALAPGYAANVEAFTTVVPEALPLDGLGQPVIFDSPNTPTIPTLGDHANAHLEAPASGNAGPATDGAAARAAPGRAGGGCAFASLATPLAGPAGRVPPPAARPRSRAAPAPRRAGRPPPGRWRSRPPR